jgi:hypothetical protein
VNILACSIVSRPSWSTSESKGRPHPEGRSTPLRSKVSIEPAGILKSPKYGVSRAVHLRSWAYSRAQCHFQRDRPCSSSTRIASETSACSGSPWCVFHDLFLLRSMANALIQFNVPSVPLFHVGVVLGTDSAQDRTYIGKRPPTWNNGNIRGRTLFARRATGNILGTEREQTDHSSLR